MSKQVSHGAGSRRPVYSGNRRVRGLHERTLADGTVVYEARLRIDGKDMKVVLDATTKTDAIHEHEGLRVDRQRGEVRHDQLTPTVDELWPDLIAHMQARVGITDKRRRYAQSTVDLYEQRLRDHISPVLGTKRLGEITADDLHRLIDTLTAKKLAPSTITSAVNIVSRLFRYARKRRLVAHNPVRDLDRDDRPGAKRQSEPRYLSADELEALLANMSDTMRPIAAACTYAALRISEALGLRWRDVDFKAGTITVAGQLGRDGKTWVPVPKTEASAATLRLLPVLQRELAEHRVRQAQRNLQWVRPDALVFTTMRGKPQSRRNVLRAVYAAGDKVGLNGEGVEPVGLHDLRHSFVAVAFDRELTAPEVAMLARHANPKVTLAMYAGLTDEGREKAVEKLAEGGFGR
jgi:integrase